jgi:hypothetical protein
MATTNLQQNLSALAAGRRRRWLRLRLPPKVENPFWVFATNRKLLLQQPFANRPNCGLRAIRDTDLSQNVLHVFFDRFVADVERVGDLFVC